VLLLPGYAPPGWLAREGVPGRAHDLTVRGRGLGARVAIGLWIPEDADPSEPLPLLVAHDGPEYDELAALTRFTAVAIRTGDLPRHRVALLAPGERDEWYSASARYADAVVHDVLPAIADAVAVRGAPAGLGTSLGALAMLHVQRRHPRALGALFLQSGSFFMPRFDAHEARFPRYKRIVRFVGRTLRDRAHPLPVPVTLTCGSAEENVHNNRVMARALSAQGYPAELHQVPDTHNYTAWRDAFEPYLTGLLARAW
jgi:enterochelin esterase-like enzyme